MSSIVSAFTDSLSRPFDSKELGRHPLTLAELHTLSLSLEAHHRGFQIPNKDPFTLRPSISTDFRHEIETGLSYSLGGRNFDRQGGYTFDKHQIGRMTNSIKTLLLYCDSVVIEDPLPYLLDYHRHDFTSEHSVRRAEATNALIREYSEISELLENEVLIPISEFRSQDNTPQIPDNWISSIEESLPHLTRKEIMFIANLLMKEKQRLRQMNDAADLFFPNPEYASVLREITRLTEKKFSQHSISTPFNTAVIGSLKIVDPTKLTVESIIRIRRDSSAFQDWKNFLSKSLAALDAQSVHETSIDETVVRSLRQEFSSHRDQFIGHASKGGIRSAMITGGKGIFVGATSGVATWAATGDFSTSLTVTAATGAIPAFLDLLLNVPSAIKSSRDARMFRSHFLAMGMDADELT